MTCTGLSSIFMMSTAARGDDEIKRVAPLKLELHERRRTNDVFRTVLAQRQKLVHRQLLLNRTDAVSRVFRDLASVCFRDFGRREQRSQLTSQICLNFLNDLALVHQLEILHKTPRVIPSV